MKVEKKVEVIVMDDNAKEVVKDDKVLIVFKSDKPDVYGQFEGLAKRNSINVKCTNNTYTIKYDSIAKMIKE